MARNCSFDLAGPRLYSGHVGPDRCVFDRPLLLVFGDRSAIFWPFTVGTILIGGWASHQTGQFTGISDDGRIVVDEVAGAALLLAFVRPRDHWKTALLLIGYLAIDGMKPWPMSAMEALPSAYGVMGDDLMIAVLAGMFLIPLRLWQARRN